MTRLPNIRELEFHTLRRGATISRRSVASNDRRDEDGDYFIVDRKKDVIIRGGENVYCVEVETALLEHPHVRDVAVLGLPHPELGEIVACVIQPSASAPVPAQAEADLRAYLEDKLAKFKIPSRYAFTKEDLPRTATGKLLKRDMRTKFFG